MEIWTSGMGSLSIGNYAIQLNQSQKHRKRHLTKAYELNEYTQTHHITSIALHSIPHIQPFDLRMPVFLLQRTEKRTWFFVGAQSVFRNKFLINHNVSL